MFGYVKIDKNELKVKDYNWFKACYCGVCKTLQHEYGFPARYFLSYDATFLAVLLSALAENEPQLCPGRCMANPFIRRPIVQKEPALLYAAAVNVLLVWFKLKDDWHDNRSVRALLLMPFMYGKYRKAKKQYPAQEAAIREKLSALSALEAAHCTVADEVAAIFGELMAALFDTEQAGSTDHRRVLGHMGFLLGRFIYLLDAWEDREADRQKGCYNPFLSADAPKKEDVQLSLEYTLGQLAADYALLVPVRHQAILENCIYLGLRHALDRAFNENIAAQSGEKEKHHERPL